MRYVWWLVTFLVWVVSFVIWLLQRIFWAMLVQDNNHGFAGGSDQTTWRGRPCPRPRKLARRTHPRSTRKKARQ